MENYFSNIIAKKRGSQLVLTLVTVASLLSIASCNAVFEKDITDSEVTLIIPTQNDTVEANQVHFKWVTVQGADYYNLQIVKTAFDDIDDFVLDSNVVGEEFYQVLAPGNYEFKIRAENGAYQSEYTAPRKIFVDTVSDLSGQFISLISPSNAFYSNGSSNINVAWQNLFAADKYEYTLKVGETYEGGSIIDQDLDVTALSYVITATNFSVEGIYHWGIRGTNNTSASLVSSRSIYIDKTAPNSPTAISPATMTTIDVGDEATMKWTTGIDPGAVNSTVFSTVEISETEGFEDFDAFPTITSDSLSYTFGTEGTYYWRVRADDAVGNSSEFYSTARQIIVE